MGEPQVSWDLGTAYDFFLSLYVLSNPEKTGLRPSWAAGVRSRLSTEDRKTLEDAVMMFGEPVHWVHSLPAPKDCATALWELRRIPAEDRLATLTLDAGIEPDLADFLMNLKECGEWRESDLETLRRLSGHHKENLKREEMEAVLNGWVRPGEFGERYLGALNAYFQVFFAEEEPLILPALETALEQARAQAQALPLVDLIESLSQGLKVPGFLEREELIFVPSYWITPLIYMAKLAPQREIIVFGARPPDASLIPGQIVPDMLLSALKALADPTRLRILRYLTEEPLTPAELSRRLRLRAPTVIHHLNMLRAAGLVSIIIKGPDDRRYTARLEGAQQLPGLLNDFLAGKKP